jgi:hypothetical protein
MARSRDRPAGPARGQMEGESKPEQLILSFPLDETATI